MIFGNREHTCMQYLQFIKLMVVDTSLDLHQSHTLEVKRVLFIVLFLFNNILNLIIVKDYSF